MLFLLLVMAAFLVVDTMDAEDGEQWMIVDVYGADGDGVEVDVEVIDSAGGVTEPELRTAAAEVDSTLLLLLLLLSSTAALVRTILQEVVDAAERPTSGTFCCRASVLDGLLRRSACCRGCGGRVRDNVELPITTLLQGPSALAAAAAIAGVLDCNDGELRRDDNGSVIDVASGSVVDALTAARIDEVRSVMPPSVDAEAAADFRR